MDLQHKFSTRIKAIAANLSKGTFLADIGSDHAYLPCYVCLHDSRARAIAGEINTGPYKSACETVRLFDLNDQIDVRQGDGLTVLHDDPVEELVIAGMGGSLITHILEHGKAHLSSVNKIIAQPNIGEHNVRRWLIQNQFEIIDESLIKENHHIYEIIVAKKCKNKTETVILNPREILLGPILLKEKTPLFYEKWKIRLHKTEQIKQQVKQAQKNEEGKIAQLDEEIQWIKEAILT